MFVKIYIHQYASLLIYMHYFEFNIKISFSRKERVYKDFLEKKALTPSIEHVSINLKDVIK